MTMDNPLYLKGLVVILLAFWAWDVIKTKRKKRSADPAIAHADARERNAWRYVRWGVSGNTDRLCALFCTDADSDLTGVGLQGVREQTKELWSGRRESNPRIELGKLSFYH